MAEDSTSSTTVTYEIVVSTYSSALGDQTSVSMDTVTSSVQTETEVGTTTVSVTVSSTHSSSVGENVDTTVAIVTSVSQDYSSTSGDCSTHVGTQ
jgi:hypothetical protein